MEKAKNEFKGGSVFSVREDYTEQVSAKRKVLGRHLKEARDKGQYARITYDKLIIDNSIYRLDQKTNDIVHVGSARVQRQPIRDKRQSSDGIDQSSPMEVSVSGASRGQD